MCNDTVVQLGIEGQALNRSSYKRELLCQAVSLVLGASAVLETSDVRLRQPVAVRVLCRKDRPVAAHVVIELVGTVNKVARHLEVGTCEACVVCHTQPVGKLSRNLTCKGIALCVIITMTQKTATVEVVG